MRKQQLFEGGWCSVKYNNYKIKGNMQEKRRRHVTSVNKYKILVGCSRKMITNKDSKHVIVLRTCSHQNRHKGHVCRKYYPLDMS